MTKIFTLAMALCVISATAFAQTTTSTATSTATAGDVTVNTGGGSSGGSSSASDSSGKRPVASAYAPGLVAGSDTCMGSSSAGAQGMSFGIAFGSTWQDKNCELLKLSRELGAMGMLNAQLAMLCQDARVVEAMKASDGVCPSSRGITSEQATNRWQASAL